MSSVTDDFGWFWAGEHGRDEILRDSVESLHSQLSQSSRQSYRLSSQLAELKGSFEARLAALSIAFDAYVELGDIREQLAGYPDTSQIRREVRDALAAVTDGRPSTPIDPRGLDYWLPYATNAVLAITAGSADAEAEQKARALSPDSELYIVAAAAAVGHGSAVRNRLPDLLVADGSLSEAQLALWRAACAGRYGAVEAVLAEIEPIWQPAIGGSEPSSWLGWVRAHAEPGPVGTIEWVRRLSEGAPAGPSPGPPEGHADQPVPEPAASTRSTSSTDPAPASTTGLRAIVSELASRGVGGEAELLARARELRSVIESPSPAADQTGLPDRASSPAAAEPPGTTVVDAVRATLLDPPADAAAHRVLLGWSAAPLAAVVEVTEAEAARPPTFAERVPSPAGPLEVTAAGADPTQVDQRIDRIRTDGRPSPLGLSLLAGAAAVCLVIGVVLVVVNDSGPWVLFFLLAGVGGIGALYQLRRRISHTNETEADVQRFRDRLEETKASVRAEEQSWRDELEQVRRVAEQARAGLRQPVAAGRPEALR